MAPNNKININYIYVAEVIRDEQSFFDINKSWFLVKVRTLSEITENYIKILANEMGSSLKDGNESKVLPRFIKFLIQHSKHKQKRIKSDLIYDELKNIDFAEIRENLQGKKTNLKKWLNDE